MSLASVDSLNHQLLSLPPTLSSLEGATQFINCIADYMDKVQAGPTGSPGIFTYLRPPAIAAILSLPPVIDNSWIVNFANAVHLGTTGAILVPGTVTFAAWTASITDTFATPVNTTMAAALPVLVSGLQPVTSANNPAMPMAQAIHDYTLIFNFLCTGTVLAPPGPPIPLPLPFPAQ